MRACSLPQSVQVVEVVEVEVQQRILAEEHPAEYRNSFRRHWEWLLLKDMTM